MKTYLPHKSLDAQQKKQTHATLP